MISIANDHHLTFSNLSTGRAEATLDQIHAFSLRELTISDDGNWLATADSGGTVRLWETSR